MQKKKADSSIIKTELEEKTENFLKHMKKSLKENK